LRGHGHDIDDLAVHPVDLNLVLSASKDESIRLWNIKTSICIAIFGGERAHRDDVLSIDIHLLGNCFVSGGMDTSIKVWNLASPVLQKAVADSYNDPSTTTSSFNTVFEQFPLFSTTQLHKDYVDTVAWVGNLIVSKSTDNRAALWAPDPDRYLVTSQPQPLPPHAKFVMCGFVADLIGGDVCTTRVPTERLPHMVCSLWDLRSTGPVGSGQHKGQGIQCINCPLTNHFVKYLLMFWYLPVCWLLWMGSRCGCVDC
jgi:WD40 repeat protein